jgi:general secretion pathway protein G
MMNKKTGWEESMSVHLKDRKSEEGMTLVELIIVVVILTMLAAALGLTVGRQFRKATPKTAQLAISQIEGALELYMVEVGDYPGQDVGLDALMQNPGNAVNWNGPYLKKVPQDPWGKPYVYRFPGTHNMEFDLCSNGADGIEATEDDICNWK